MVSSIFNIKVFLLTICFVLALLPHQSNAKAVVQRRQAVATIQNNWVTVCAPGTGSDPNFTNNNQVQKRDDSVMTLNDMHSKPTRTVDCSTATATTTPTATSAPDNNPPPKSTGSCNAQCWNQYLWSKYSDLESIVKRALADIMHLYQIPMAGASLLNLVWLALFVYCLVSTSWHLDSVASELLLP